MDFNKHDKRYNHQDYIRKQAILFIFERTYFRRIFEFSIYIIFF